MNVIRLPVRKSDKPVRFEDQVPFYAAELFKWLVETDLLMPFIAALIEESRKPRYLDGEGSEYLSKLKRGPQHYQRKIHMRVSQESKRWFKKTAVVFGDLIRGKAFSETEWAEVNLFLQEQIARMALEH